MRKRTFADTRVTEQITITQKIADAKTING
jgi:hypothetical protein